MKLSEEVKAASTVALLWAFLSLAWHAHGATIFPSTYDDQIRISVKQFWPDYPDWIDWKAQLYQESKLDPNARSAAGAEGLAQFMPGTWSDIERQLGYGTVSRKLAGPAIQGGAVYMARLRHSWINAARPIDDSQRLGQASYNGGIGNILKAQRACDQALLWVGIAPCLPGITGQQNAAQTQGYVRSIARWRGMMH